MEFGYYIPNGSPDGKTLSKSFIQELKRQVSKLLKEQVGELLDIKSTYVSIKSIIMRENFISETNLSVNYIDAYSCDCKLLWRSNINDDYVSGEQEVAKDSLLFWIENLDSEYIRIDLIKYSYLRKKTFLEGYRFVVEIKEPDIDIYLKLLFKEKISEIIATDLEIFLGEIIANYNRNSQIRKEECEGLIHSFSLREFKQKDSITFKIDLGHAVDIALKFILNKLSESEYNIKKIEVKGV